MGLLWPFTYTRNKKDIPQCYIINFRKEDYFLLLCKKLICLRFLETYLIIRLNIVLNLKKNTSFFDDSWVMRKKVRLGALLFNYNINMQKWRVTVLDVFCQFLTAVKLASFHLNNQGCVINCNYKCYPHNFEPLSLT